MNTVIVIPSEVEESRCITLTVFMAGSIDYRSG